MADHEHDDDHHGHSLAAWVMVGLLLLATAVMSVAMVLPNTPLLIGGAVLAIVGLVAGKVLSLAGHGVDGAAMRSSSNLS